MKLKTLLCAIIIFLILFAFTAKLKAQTVPPEGVTITKAIPASADAAALGKYGSIPVSLYTGVPNISIPLYTIKSGDLTLPVSLSYHAGGIKVEEMASSVGLGWVLSGCGAAITRTIRGKADEAPNGFLDPANNFANVYKRINQNSGPLTLAQANQALNLMADGTLDSEPDLYNFNFGSYSGKFVMDNSGNVTIIPRQNIQFTFQIYYGQTTYISAFTAKTPDGVIYYFGSDNDGNDARELTNSSFAKTQNVMSWFIKRIVSPTGHEIDFSYSPGSYTQGQAPSQTMYYWVSGDNGGPAPGGRQDPKDIYNLSSNAFTTVRLNTVTFENGSLTVHADSTRRDLNCNYINSLTFASSGFAKTYNLYYNNTGKVRLRLDSLIGLLEPISGTNNFKEEKYSFTYNPDPWTPNPSNFIFMQDWWGYYNGQGNSINGQGTLVPKMRINVGATPVDLPGAVRAPDQGNMLGAMLTQINYPTGGFTTFNFEANHEANADLGGTSTVGMGHVTAMSNDPANSYYNYDINIHNTLDTMYVYANSSIAMPIALNAGGLRGPNQPANEQLTAYIYNSANVNIYNITNTDTTIYLFPGTYHIKVLDNKNQAYDPVSNPLGYKYFIAAMWTNADAGLLNNYVAGGVRIQQIADYDGINSTPFNVKTYLYNLPGQKASTGYLDFQPVYSYQLTVNVGGGYNYLFQNNYLVRTAVSNYPLATTQGSVVGYSYVQELIGGSGQNGKNDYYYTNSAIYPDLQNGPTGFPYAPAASQDWHRGLLTRETNWKQMGNGVYAKVQEKKNVYTTDSLKWNVAIKAGFNPKPALYDPSLAYYGGPPANGDGVLLQTSYTDNTDFTFLSSDTTITYNLSDTTKIVKTVDSYQYDPITYQLTQAQTLNSKSELITQNITYPNNYSSIVSAPPYLYGVMNLAGSGIVAYPIEEITQKSNANGTNLRTVKAVLTTYKANRPYRDLVYVMRSPAGVTGFVNGTAGVMDSHYQQVVSFDKYDAYGNIMQEKKIGDALHCYVWGYANTNSPHLNTYPVAEVVNADSASIAYTNFEQLPGSGNVAGNWAFNFSGVSTDVTAPMGSKCFTVSSTNTVVKSGLSTAASYVVSFWAKSGAAVMVTGGTVTNMATGNAKSGWLYHEYQVTGTASVTIGGSGLIDEVRLYPVNAQMSTYTYTPLAGMASKCDTKNDITYYIYDNVGRLIAIQDQNRNIIKDYQYNYTQSAPVIPPPPPHGY